MASLQRPSPPLDAGQAAPLTMATGYFERRFVTAAVSLTVATVVVLAVAGVLALHGTPILVDDTGIPLTDADAARLRKLGSTELDPNFVLQVPEFFRRADEARWWDTHHLIHETLISHERITAEIAVPDGSRETRHYRTAPLGFMGIVHRVGLVYLAALLYLLTAVSALVKDRAPHSAILAVFALSGALYLVSSAAIANRSLTLAFPYFKLLLAFHFIGSSGLIALAHYALVFPGRKRFLDRLPVSPSVILYGHALVTSVLYLTGVMAFGATLPNMFFWTAFLACAFLHSLLTEQDRFLRRQIALSLAVPLLVTAVFVFLHVLPGAVGTTPISFSTFALFSVMLPLSLSAAIDNVRMYRQQLDMEARALSEHEKIRRDLHDDTLNRLAGIARLSEASLASVDKDRDSIRQRLQCIKERAMDYSRQVRGLLWLTDEQCATWDDLAGQLRSHGYELTGERGVEFRFDLSQDGHSAAPTPAVKVCLYRVFAEALANALKHASARDIAGRLSVSTEAVQLEIKDDGVGFEPGCTVPGHYGLNNMRSRAEELGGTLVVESRPGGGAGVNLTLPLTANYRN